MSTIDAAADDLEVLRFSVGFARRLAHEIRSPVGVLAGVLSEVETGKTGADIAPMVSIGHRSLARLQRLANRMDLVSQIAENSLPTGPAERFDLAAAVRTAGERAQVHAGRRKVTLEVALAEGTKVERRGRPELLERATEEVIGNALRHARSKVVVTLENEGSSPTIVVRDDGRGLSERAHADLFRPQRGIDSGLGLGLWIADRLASAAGDFAVSLVSSSESGTIFAIRWTAT